MDNPVPPEADPPPTPSWPFAVPLTVALGTAGYLLGIALLLSATDLTFRELLVPAERAVWASLIAGQVALWAVLAPPLVVRLLRYRGELWKRPVGSAVLVVSLAVLFYLFMSGHRPDPGARITPVDRQSYLVMAVSALGFLPMLGALLGIHAVSLRAGAVHAARTVEARVAGYLRAREDMGAFLMTAGLIIGAATLSTGALHRALEALNPGTFTFKPSLILLYGAYGSGAIALVYVPAHAVTARAGRRIADAWAPLPTGEAAAVVSWRKERDAVEAALGLETNAWESLKGGLSVLYPLLASAIPLLFGLGK